MMRIETSRDENREGTGGDKMRKETTHKGLVEWLIGR